MITIHDVGAKEAFILTNEHDIFIKTKYIRSPANVWADRLSRETDNADMQLPTRVFRYYDTQWGPRSIKQAAPALQRQVERQEGRGCGLHQPSVSEMTPRK